MTTTHTTNEHTYGLAGYRWYPWLQTTAYYSLLYPNIHERSRRDHHQHDAAVSARFDITPHWIVKVEGHFLVGTAALSSDLNNGMLASDLVNHWWLAAAKTTVYFSCAGSLPSFCSPPPRPSRCDRPRSQSRRSR